MSRRAASTLLLPALGVLGVLGLVLLVLGVPQRMPWWPGFKSTRPRARTILLLTPDTLRRDHVSAYAPADGRVVHPRTPHLDRLAATGTRFDDARSPVPLTLPAHVTMLSGLPPARTGVRINTYGRLPAPTARGFPLLPERLRAHGWHTAGFVSAAVLGRRYGLEQGFAHFDDGDLRDLSQHAVPERTGPQTVAAALAHVQGVPRDQPLFLWVHLFEPHAPYARDGTYPGDVEALDDAVGLLLDGLADLGRGDGVVLVAADHGEALGELDERTHGVLLADGVLRVPFLLRAPGTPASVRTDPVGLEDIAPTLAALAQVPWEPAAGPGGGHDLLAGVQPADRLRVAESIYAHHRFRWAQLVAAIGSTGTLVDAGRHRLHWIPPGDFQRNASAPVLPPAGEESQRLGDFIAQYKLSEVADRIRQGQAAGGYGGGGQVLPFLPAVENGRLPDPYGSVLRAHTLDQISLTLRRFAGLEAGLRAQVAALEAMDTPILDAGNPELHFLLGEAWMRLGALLGDVGALARAERETLRAFELGRKDTETLARACGVNALGREQEMLGKLDALAHQLDAPGCQVRILRIRLLRALHRDAEASEAWIRAQAEGICDNPRDRALWAALRPPK